ncbi:Bacterial protein of uncharacterised function (DUF961) [Listeria grayi]|uniref:Conjugative transposon protein n=1 Tax=Listeria grayi FSL F6-1183 TaxID=1265827 RepID=A0A829R501_LISGR|nr:DUF961 family protein [Listeria grayi]EUJ26645.1 hypothetical protein LMUR_12596 [Listeria grayi FSL F6-1183]VEI35965.1 Bacterial protein of uncharacterised function (DUF961) [Listeria grayi]
MIRVNKQNKLTSDNIDLEKTFGKLKFIGTDGQQMETADGEYTGEVKARRYGVKSEAQDDILTIFVPAEKENLDIPFMAEVKLKNIKITPFVGVNDNNRPIVNYKIEAENIVPVNATSKPVEPEKTKPQK